MTDNHGPSIEWMGPPRDERVQWPQGSLDPRIDFPAASTTANSIGSHGQASMDPAPPATSLQLHPT